MVQIAPVEALEKQVATLKQIVGSDKGLKNALEAAQSDLATARSERASLSEECNTTRKRIEELAAEMEKQAGVLAEKVDELAQMGLARKQAETSLAAASAETSNLLAKIETLQAAAGSITIRTT